MCPRRRHPVALRRRGDRLPTSILAGKPLSCAQLAYDRRYRRPVVRCFLDGQDLSQRLVRAGWAVAYRRYSTDYVATEAAAKAAGVGIWQGAFTTPETWRRDNRRTIASAAALWFASLIATPTAADFGETLLRQVIGLCMTSATRMGRNLK